MVLLFPLKVNAWGDDIHRYLCPEELTQVKDGCKIADTWEFVQQYPHSELMNHLCLDNKPDCPAKVLAKYYVKKYYIEGKKDLNLLAAAAHLIQDANVPDHWFPMRAFGEKIFVPFVPSWVGKTEGLVSMAINQRKTDWNFPREFGGKTFNINLAYLENIKAQIAETISHEPTESLAMLEAQIKQRSFWQKVRSYRELAQLGLLILLPFLVFCFWRWESKKQGKVDFLILAIFWLALLIFYLLTFLY